MRIEYPQAVLDPDTGELVSCAEVAEVEYTAFNSHGSKAVPGRLIVRRVPERNTNTLAAAAQEGLFTVCRQQLSRPWGAVPALPLARFPKAARRTRRATLTAPGSPQLLPLWRGWAGSRGWGSGFLGSGIY